MLNEILINIYVTGENVIFLDVSPYIKKKVI